MMKVHVVCGLLVSLMVFSCIGLFDNGFDEALFRKERAAWEAQGLRYYRFAATCRASFAGFAPETFECTVFPDREAEVVLTSHYMPDVYYGDTIDEIYQYIADTVANGGHRLNITVRYNKEYHYPEYLFESSRGGGSDELEITEFEPLGE
ncbi:MAG: DUF6174 domain-containing protein [Spirochaetaceae bacterium]|nr:DUF6174 domain-containing protein [Spirochaetaceae bacterium]